MSEPSFPSVKKKIQSLGQRMYTESDLNLNNSVTAIPCRNTIYVLIEKLKVNSACEVHNLNGDSRGFHLSVAKPIAENTTASHN